MRRRYFAETIPYLLALLLVLPGSFGCSSSGARAREASSPGRNSLSEILDAEFEHQRRRDKATSYVVTIVDDQGPIYEGAFGQADLRNEKPATLDTLYRWGSNSKVLVMLALLQLEQRGLLALDDPLNKHLPEFSIGSPPPTHPGSAAWSLDDISLRSMLTHHSGLPNDYLKGFLTRKPLGLGEYLDGIRVMRAQQPVGLCHSYSNLAYSLLGAVIERASGESFDHYMREHLFLPAGMQRATFSPAAEAKAALARSYDHRGEEVPFYEISAKPAGALVATTREMGLFATALLRGGLGKKGRLLDQQVLESSYVRQNGDVPLDFDLKQGLAWMIDARPVETFGHNVQHGGTILSHHTAFVLLREHGLGVLVATNSDRGARSVQELAGKALAFAIQAKTKRPLRLPPSPSPVTESTERDLNLVDAWAGHYATPLGDVSAERKHDEVRLEVQGRHFFLRPVEPAGMGIWAKFLGLWDVQPGGLERVHLSLVRVLGREVVVRELPRGRELLGVKYEPVRVTDPWKKRVGRYRATEDFDGPRFLTGMELILEEGGYLFARPEVAGQEQALPSSALHPVDEHWAVTEGIGRNKSVWMRFDEAGRLHFSGLVFMPTGEKPKCFDGHRCPGPFFKHRGLMSD